RTAPGSRRTGSGTPARRGWSSDGRTGGRTSPPGPLSATRRGGTGVRTPGRPLSSEPPRNVSLGLLFRGLGEQLLGAVGLGQVTRTTEAGGVGGGRGWL